MKSPTTYSDPKKINHVCFHHSDLPALQITHEQTPASMRRIYTSTEPRLKILMHVNTHTQDVYFNPHLPWKPSQLTEIWCPHMYEMLICSLLTLNFFHSYKLTSQHASAPHVNYNGNTWSQGHTASTWNRQEEGKVHLVRHLEKDRWEMKGW